MFNANSKLSVLIVLVLTLSVSASAQTPEGPLQDFEFSPSDSFQRSFTGGETVSFSADFTNPVQKKLPLVVRLEVSGPEMTETGEEFDVASSIESKRDESKNTGLECRARKEDGDLIYNCLKDGEREIMADSENTVTLDAESSPAIASGDYEMEFSILSMIGAPRNSGSFDYTDLMEGITIGEGNERVMISVEFDSEEAPSGKVEVSTMDSIGVKGPLDEFVNGVDVEMEEAAEQQDYTADLRVYYDQGGISDLDENSLTLYRYQPDTGSWEEITSAQNSEQNYLEADLSRFSIYAIYGEEKQQSGGRNFNIEYDRSEQEQTGDEAQDLPPANPNNETEKDDEVDNETVEERTVGENRTVEDESEEQPVDETDENTGGNILTGQFAQSAFNPSNIFKSLISFLTGLF